MTTGPAPVLLWFRRDLRLADNPALSAAAATGRPVLMVFVLEPESSWPLGAAGRWWLHHSLQALIKDLADRGHPLMLLRGAAQIVVTELATATGADTVFWNLRHEPDAVAVDRQVKAALRSAGVAVHAHQGTLLRNPGDLTTGKGGPYHVFTPYYRKFLDSRRPGAVLPLPPRTTPCLSDLPSQSLASLKLLPAGDRTVGMRNTWTPGEAGAKAELARFLAEGLIRYDQDRDMPGLCGTSRLSPHLHWGEISPGQVWQSAETRSHAAAAPFLRQLVWREFAHHLLHHFPHTTVEPLREQYATFPWDGDPTLLPAWQHGLTGYPLVDAGMRQLWATGWMHNRVRMVAASFLVKHLLLPWQEGARWFWDTLVDADLANNTFGWQWTAGCGADAAPFFRIFNPTAQGKRFDKEGKYIKHWVPELAALPAALIHEPWRASAGELQQYGLKLGRDYPHPVVDHSRARLRALESYGRMRSG